MSTPTPLLEVRDLAVEFDTLRGVARAVADATFSVGRSETVGLVGESGSGKSVTGSAILGLIAPGGAVRAGTITFDGVDMTALSETELRHYRGPRISMIVQNPLTALNPLMRIGRQIDRVYMHHTGASADAARQRRLELLQAVRISDPESVSRRYPHQLSGGMAQRVMIVMALICQPDLVIADEPTTGLDVTVQRQILDLLRDLQRESEMAVLLITHDLGVVAQSCDRVVVMYAGNVVEVADTEQLFAVPRHPYTRGLLDSAPRLDDTPSALMPGSVPSAFDRVAGCPFHPRCERATDICRGTAPTLATTDERSAVACYHPLDQPQVTTPVGA